MSKTVKLIIILIILAGLATAGFLINRKEANNTANNTIDNTPALTKETEKQAVQQTLPEMAIESLRQQQFTGGDFVIEKTLADTNSYYQYIASYRSEGLKIFGLLTVPLTSAPENGYPGIVFVHGYIPPNQYSTTGNYPTYQAALARAGFVTFKPDLRGHGDSEGEAASAHHSADYVIDTMNAMAYLKKYPLVDASRLGYWGHSNGGEIGLRVLVISPDIKAASFWAGVVGSYEDMFETYNDKIRFLRNVTSTDLVLKHGLPSENPAFWNQLDPYNYLNDITAPIQLQHSIDDESVPIELSQSLKKELERLNKSVEYFEYQNDDHNIAANSSLAWQRTIDFFRKYL